MCKNCKLAPFEIKKLAILENAYRNVGYSKCVLKFATKAIATQATTGASNVVLPKCARLAGLLHFEIKKLGILENAYKNLGYSECVLKCATKAIATLATTGARRFVFAKLWQTCKLAPF